MQRVCAVFSSVVSPVLLYFSTLSHKQYGFRKEVTENKMCGLVFFAPFVLHHVVLCQWCNKRNFRPDIELFASLLQLKDHTAFQK